MLRALFRCGGATATLGRVERHFTVSGFVSDGERTALHWHRLGMWLPAGGHVERDEDPIQAVLREVLEETGIEVEVVATVPPYPHSQPPQLAPPVTIGVYKVDSDPYTDAPHQHIDFVYFTRPLAEATPALPDREGWLWVAQETLCERPCMPPMSNAGAGEARRPVAEDVRRLGLASIAAVRAARDGAS